MPFICPELAFGPIIRLDLEEALNLCPEISDGSPQVDLEEALELCPEISAGSPQVNSIRRKESL